MAQTTPDASFGPVIIVAAFPKLPCHCCPPLSPATLFIFKKKAKGLLVNDRITVVWAS